MCKQIPFDHKINALLHCIPKVLKPHADASWIKRV